MNHALIPAAIAAGGGTALYGVVAARETRLDARMRASRVRYAVRFPQDTDSARARGALAGLAGLPESCELVAQVVASSGRIQHHLLVPAAVRSSVQATLSAAFAGVRLTEIEPPTGRAMLTLKLYVPPQTLLRDSEAEIAARTLLGGLAGLQTEHEQVAISWALRPSRPRPAPSVDSDDRAARELARLWQAKTALPGLKASGLVVVRADTFGRARQLLDQVSDVLRSRRGRNQMLRGTVSRGNRSLAALPQVTRSSGWLSSDELIGLLGWPLDEGIIPGVERGTSRELSIPQGLTTEGRPLLVGRDAAGTDRRVTLSTEAARHGVAILGPSGVGKSSLIAAGVLSDMAAGFSGVVIDPKGPDLVNAIAERVPAGAAHRVVILNPAASGPVVGLNVIAGGDPERRTEVLLGVLRGVTPEWGIRSEVFGRLAIRSLCAMPGATLADMGRLFSDDSYRRAAVARLSDPLLVGAWQDFENLSPSARAERIEAPMTRLMALIARPAVRAVLANPAPKLDISDLLDRRGWLLVSLSPGVLGETAAQLIGGALMHSVWNAIEARAGLPPAQRTPIYLVIDELASVARGLPHSLELTAERARGLGAGLVVALQSLGRLDDTTRAALLTNLSTLVSFRAPADEAVRIARELPGLRPSDLQALGRFEVAARVGTGLGASVAVVTGRTEPLPPITGQLGRIRRMSAQQFGTEPNMPSGTVERADESPIGRQRRPS